MKEKLSKELKNKILRNMFVKNYRRMWPYIKPYWFRGVLSLLLAIPIGSLDAVIAMALKPYMDLVMVEKQFSRLGIYLLELLLLLLFKVC